MRRAHTLLPLLLCLALPGRAAAVSAADLARLRSLYLEAVSDGRAVAKGLEEVESLRAGTAAGGETTAVLAAYEGALYTLRAKHERWPPAKLRYLRRGLGTLDGVVSGHPDLAEARYLRLMSCYYLPGFFGRRGSVREDFHALARLLPMVRGRYPRPLYDAILRFVVEKGGLSPEERRPLESLLSPPNG